MIIVKLMGGLGNQMFQYAFGRHLQERHHTTLKFDTSEFELTTGGLGFVPRKYDLDIFGIEVEVASAHEVSGFRDRVGSPVVDKLLNRILGRKKSYIFELPVFNFVEERYNAPDNTYFEGYWQSQKYFADVEEIIRQEFTFRDPLQPNSVELLAQIEASNSVCVNVRRGDFVTNERHGWYGTDYFARGEAIIAERTSDHCFYVFSDDIEWCVENLRFERPTTFVSHDYAGRKFQDYLRLMAACRHFIIPNSSFAWWAVWLNEDSEKIVVAPERWTNVSTLDTRDLYQPGWIVI
jgi:hypothetical protein